MGLFQSKQIKVAPNSQRANSFIKAQLNKIFPNNKNSDLYQRFINKNKYPRMFGCMFGSIIGDALGAFCEFQDKRLNKQLLNTAMKMNGGGTFNLQKGQFTDDSELAYHLLKGLASFNTKKLFQEQTNQILMNISKQYIEWYGSDPFDMGITCSRGIQVLLNSNLNNKKQSQNQKDNSLIQQTLKKVEEVNNKSQSNGSLMRIAPMPIFFSLIQQNPEKYRQFIENQIGLIHGNGVLREAGYIWVKVIYDLINRQDDHKQTFKQIFDNAQRSAKNREVISWFIQSKQNDKISAVDKMGWAKIAWTYGMNVLYKQREKDLVQLNYYEQIKQVIRQGGDSDTNAAIVGGMLGAILGFNQLPYEYLQKLFSLQFPSNRIKRTDRPKIYEPLNVLQQLLKLMSKCENYVRQKKVPV